MLKPFAIAGVVLSVLGLDPWNIITSVERLIRAVWNMGFDAVRWLWQYFLLGAVIVIPVWLILRIVRTPRSITVVDTCGGNDKHRPNRPRRRS